MEIQFKCLFCNAKVFAAPTMEGQRVNCPECNAAITVPALMEGTSGAKLTPDWPSGAPLIDCELAPPIGNSIPEVSGSSSAFQPRPFEKPHPKTSPASPIKATKVGIGYYIIVVIVGVLWCLITTLAVLRARVVGFAGFWRGDGVLTLTFFSVLILAIVIVNRHRIWRPEID